MKSAYEKYFRLTRISQLSGYPVNFRKDLTVHDYNKIMQNDPAVFLSVLRENGTHLYLEEEFLSDGFADELRALLKTYSEARAYLYVEGEFTDITDTIPGIDRIRSDESIEIIA